MIVYAVHSSPSEGEGEKKTVCMGSTENIITKSATKASQLRTPPGHRFVFLYRGPISKQVGTSLWMLNSLGHPSQVPPPLIFFFYRFPSFSIDSIFKVFSELLSKPRMKCANIKYKDSSYLHHSMCTVGILSYRRIMQHVFMLHVNFHWWSFSKLVSAHVQLLILYSFFFITWKAFCK